ncbi:MAG: helix-turn-helix transcriptional regulator [Candidatus Cloacimonetes bacterium]|jgi:transcriptional regulator with XRE-family HTH domain|nr:helix-turn-helix transcriptional regulator [Candidatus Cloacimonadota bacterium]MDD3501226.1 helix-turn-helix transcriptional regulator [Candidatus Cloacimonadota bacterium]
MKNIEKVEIARASRVYRAVHRLSQSELGALCGLSQRIISFVENENFRVSDANLRRLGRLICG